MPSLLRRDTAEAYAAFRRQAPEVVTVDGRKVACMRAGEGLPSIVLLAGAGMSADSWFRVLSGAGSLGTAVAVDRPGVGRSQRAALPQTGLEVVGWLRRVVAALELPPPHLVVGHSLGGLMAQLWARTYPDEVCGVVLVDSASASEVDEGASRSGASGPDGLRRRLLALLRHGRPPGTDEADVVPETARQLAAAGPFPPVPLVVVSGGARMRGVPVAAFEEHHAAQGELPRLSPLGRQVVAGGSGHFPQMTEPGIVIDAIRSVAAACTPEAVTGDA